MLNVNDIEKLHKDFPIPYEVKRIRETIINAFENLVFDPVPHTYTVLENGVIAFDNYCCISIYRGSINHFQYSHIRHLLHSNSVDLYNLSAKLLS